MAKIRVNIISESEGFEAQGVHTAFIDMVEALRKRDEVEILVNSREKADILHAHTFGPRYWMRRGPYKGRRVMTAHVIPGSFIGSLALAELWAPVSDWYLKAAYNSADVVLCVAPHVKDDLARIGVKTRLEVLTNPVNGARFFVDPAKRGEGRRLLGLPDEAKVCVCVGQIQPRKGVAEFLDTAAACPDVIFVWLGGRPFERLTAGFDELNRKMEAKTPNALFPGVFKLDQMSALYSAADLFFFPSHQENCALAINEAMACAIPMLLRDNPEYPGLYGDSYLKGKTAEDDAGWIRKFFNEKALRDDYSARALATAGKFSVEYFADALVKIYGSLMSGPPSKSSG